MNKKLTMQKVQGFFLYILHYFFSCYFKKSTVHILLRLTVGKYHIDCKKNKLIYIHKQSQKIKTFMCL